MGYQIGSGNVPLTSDGSSYPNDTLTTQTWQNQAGAIADSDKRLDAELVNDIARTIIHIIDELGITPSGSFATVATRLNTFLPSSGAALTNGSCVFIASSVLAQDNSNYFWDNTDKTLLIGTNVNRSTAAQIVLEDNGPEIAFYESDAAADTKLWRMRVNGAQFEIFTRTDADGVGQSAFQIIRSATAVTDIRLLTAGSDRIAIDSSGNVGINRTTLANTFDLLGSARIEGTIWHYGSGNPVDSKYWRQTLQSTGWYIAAANDARTTEELAYNILRSGASITTHIFRTSNTERMRIDSSGQVQIGGSNDGDLKLTYSGGGGAVIKTVNGVGLEFLAGGSTAQIVLNTNGAVFIGDTSNIQMSQGLTVKQGTADDEILALKSDDVAHGLTSAFLPVETDTYVAFRKRNPTAGGLQLAVYSEDPAAGTQAVLDINALGGAAETTPGTSATGLIKFYVSEHNGANALTDIPANGLIFSIKARIASSNRTVFLVDAEGDVHVDAGSTTHDATTRAMNNFDEYPDWQLARALKASLLPSEHQMAQRYIELVQKYKPLFEKTGIVHYNDDTDGVPFIAMKKLALFTLDGLFQTGQKVFVDHEHKIFEHEQKIKQLENKLALLEPKIQI